MAMTEKEIEAARKVIAALDLRDRKLLHKVWLAAANAVFGAARGHNDGWQALEEALEKAEDEMGTPEDFEP